MFCKMKINDVIINNRIIRSATNEHLGSLDGLITKEYIKVYSNLAKNGVGLIITSHMAVNREQRVDETQICVNDPRNFIYLKQLSETVHKYDSKILVQLSQGGKMTYANSGVLPLTPCRSNKSKEMSLMDIDNCIENFVSAATIIEKANFDGIQLHLAHDYLLSDFLDPYYNKRKDDYGSSIKNRYKIIHKILNTIKCRCNSKFILAVKINSTSKTTNFIRDQLEICRLLEEDGVNLIEVSGMEFKKENSIEPIFLRESLKIRDTVSIPIALVGGFRNVNQMNFAIDKGIDFISMARPFICEDDLVLKLKDHKKVMCNDCNSCYSIYRNLFKRCIFHDNINQQLLYNFK